MKKRTLLATIAFIALPIMANANVLNCSIRGAHQGTAQLEILHVESHPELLVLKLQMTVNLASGADQVGQSASLGGVLAAQTDSEGNILASGILFSQGGTIINPGSITLQGTIQSNGTGSFELIDQNRVLQWGYGAWIQCQ